MIDLSILVVSYNTVELTLECLRSVYAQTVGIDFEVIVVDNASADDSADAIAREFPLVKFIRLDENVGFASANNLAGKHARGEYLLLLNSDTIVLGDAIPKLLRFAAANVGAQIYGGRTVFPDGSLNPASCWRKATLWSMFCRGVGLAATFRGTRLFDPEAYGSWKRDSVREVDIVTGCLFLIRKHLWDRLEGFDQAFFMYGEEADLCLRAKRLGAQPMICPDAQIIHYGGQSDTVRSIKIVRLFHAKARLCRKHWAPASAQLGVLMLDVWALTRLASHAVASPARQASRQSYREWRDVWRNRAAWHLRETNARSSRPVVTLHSRSSATGGREVAANEAEAASTILPVAPDAAQLSERIFIVNFHGLGNPPCSVAPSHRRWWIDREVFHAILDVVASRDDIAVTFDDGNPSDLEIALPALIDRGLGADLFITVGRLDADGYFSSSDLGRLANTGMEIGLHGMLHRPWHGLSDHELRQEIDEAADRLQQTMGQKVRRVACPFGSYGRRVLRHLRRAGFDRVYTSDGGWALRNAWLQPRNSLLNSASPEAVTRMVTNGETTLSELARTVRLFVKRWR